MVNHNLFKLIIVTSNETLGVGGNFQNVVRITLAVTAIPLRDVTR